MVPLQGKTRLRFIKVNGSEVLDGVRFLPSPGHSIDHASISITSHGEEAIFGGDLLHHPLELFDMDLLSMFCEFPEAARRSRRAIVSHIVDTGALYCSSHFPCSSAGRVVERDGHLHWTFVDPDPGSATPRYFVTR